LIKDYELEVHYHLGKAHCNYLPTICYTQEEFSTQVLPDLSLFNITLTPTLKGEIIVAQKEDEGMDQIKRRMQEGDPKVACFCEHAEGTLGFKDTLVVPKKEALKKKILDEAHTSRYSIHLGSTKMHQDWWTRMKHETSHYMSKCDTCQKVTTNLYGAGRIVATAEYFRLEVG
jgi:hypothetical protein